MSERIGDAIAFGFSLIDPREANYRSGDQLRLLGQSLVLDKYDERRQRWLAVTEDGSRVEVSPEILPKQRAMLVGFGQVIPASEKEEA